MDRRRSSTTSLAMRMVTLIVVTWLALAACARSNDQQDDQASGSTSGASATTSAAQSRGGSDEPDTGNAPAGPQGGGDSGGNSRDDGSRDDGSGGGGSGDGGSGNGGSGAGGSGNGDRPAPGSTSSQSQNAPLPRPQPGTTTAPAPRPAPGSTPSTAAAPPPRPPSTSSSRPPEETTVVVAGPTLDDDYSAAFGSVWKPTDLSTRPAPICTLFYLNDTTVQITVASVTVDAPFTTTTECAGTGVPDGPPCSVGAPLAAVDPLQSDEEAIGCQFGIALGTAGDVNINYENHNARLTLSAACTSPGAPDTPCGHSGVTDRNPSTSAPVLVTWDALTATVPLRYCGATDYDDGNGQPSGSPSESSASNGCL